MVPVLINIGKSCCMMRWYKKFSVQPIPYSLSHKKFGIKGKIMQSAFLILSDGLRKSAGSEMAKSREEDLPLLRDILTFSLIYYIMSSAIRGCTGFDRRFWAINSESGFHLPR